MIRTQIIASIISGLVVLLALWLMHVTANAATPASDECQGVQEITAGRPWPMPDWQTNRQIAPCTGVLIGKTAYLELTGK